MLMGRNDDDDEDHDDDDEDEDEDDDDDMAAAVGRLFISLSEFKRPDALSYVGFAFWI